MNPGLVLYVEDEEDDVFLLQHAFKQAGILNPLVNLPDGEVAIEYLQGAGPYANRSEHPLPSLLLLDINLPLISGLEVLETVRAQNVLRGIPALMLTSSSQSSDVQRAYQLGANGYVVKPSGLAKLLTLVEAIRDYWLIHNLPPPASSATGQREGETISKSKAEARS